MAGFRNCSYLERSDCVAHRGDAGSQASDARSQCHDLDADWLGDLGVLLCHDHAFNLSRNQTLLAEIGKHRHPHSAGVLVLLYRAIHAA